MVIDDWIVLTPPALKKEESVTDLLIFFLSSSGLMLIMSTVGTGIRGLTNWMRSVHQLNSLKQEKLGAELAFLRAQLNPHFLFNTLNLIFGHIDRKNHTARDMVLRFSDLMRYQLYECDASMVGIDKEVGYLQSFIELQKLRKNELLQCSLNVGPGVTGFGISPLLMMPIVENAFKHVGGAADTSYFLRIDIQRSADELYFTCINTRAALPLADMPGNHGIGLRNVQRRLELLYPGRHRLSIRDAVNTFEVQLMIGL